MCKVTIIADDFSSVTDCGVQFSNKNLRTLALTKIPQDKIIDVYDIISIDTDSRALGSEEAYQATLKIAKYANSLGCQRIYKSVDSLLRGNLGREIDAVLDAMSFKAALIAPAFPYYGRTTEAGMHYLNGVKISESSASQDRVCPSKVSSIPKVLKLQSKRKVAHLSIEQVRQKHDDFILTVEKLIHEGYELISMDVETEDDLKIIAEHSYLMPECLVVGSTGLAQYLAEAWKLESSVAKDKVENFGTEKSVVIVSGSISPVTGKQIKKVLLNPNVSGICLCQPTLLSAKIKDYISVANDIIDQKKDIVLYLDSSDETREVSNKMATDNGWSVSDMASKIVDALGSIIEIITAKDKVGGLILTGGDTAKAVCERLGIISLTLFNEVEPGIPIGKTVNGKPMYIVTKSGAFGSPEALTHALCSIKV